MAFFGEAAALRNSAAGTRNTAVARSPLALRCTQAISRLGVLGTGLISVLSGYASVDFPYGWGGSLAPGEACKASAPPVRRAACSTPPTSRLRTLNTPRAAAVACRRRYLSLFVRPVEAAEVAAVESQYRQASGWAAAALPCRAFCFVDESASNSGTLHRTAWPAGT